MNENLAKALVAFHKDAPKIEKDGTANYGGYPTLPRVMDTIRPKLTAQDLIIIQQPTVLDSGMPGLRTTLLHVSGESLTEVMPLAVDKPGAQALGSALTYARRYAVLAILGLVGDEDDDGNATQPAAKAKAKPKFEQPKPKPGVKPDEEANVLLGTLSTLMKDFGNYEADKPKVLAKVAGFQNLAEMKKWLRAEIQTMENNLKALGAIRS